MLETARHFCILLETARPESCLRCTRPLCEPIPNEDDGTINPVINIGDNPRGGTEIVNLLPKKIWLAKKALSQWFCGVVVPHISAFEAFARRYECQQARALRASVAGWLHTVAQGHGHRVTVWLTQPVKDCDYVIVSTHTVSVTPIAVWL